MLPYHQTIYQFLAHKHERLHFGFRQKLENKKNQFTIFFRYIQFYNLYEPEAQNTTIRTKKKCSSRTNFVKSEKTNKFKIKLVVSRYDETLTKSKSTLMTYLNNISIFIWFRQKDEHFCAVSRKLSFLLRRQEIAINFKYDVIIIIWTAIIQNSAMEYFQRNSICVLFVFMSGGSHYPMAIAFGQNVLFVGWNFYCILICLNQIGRISNISNAKNV